MAAIGDGLVLQPEEGDSISLGGIGVRFKIDGRETGGAFAVVEHPVEPGVIVEPHVHTNEDEYTFVVEGEIGARVGDQEIVARAGTWLFKPRGVLHTFWNRGPGSARLVEVISPAGFEHFFRELGQLLHEGAEEERIGGLADRFGLRFDRSWVPALMAKHNLTTLV